MKAAIHTKYGPPEVVQIKEVPKPQPKANEVLIKVHASTVNRTDCGFRSAQYFISRFWSGLFYPKYKTLGCEFAGEIESIGPEVTEFKQGDMVFGYNDEHFGGHAEYIIVESSGAVALLPQNMSYFEAAAITEGAHYALTYVRAAKIKKGQNTLVYGATGAIGSAAVQLLKHFGARVTAVGNTKNIALLKSLGAEEVMDYQTQDFTKTDQTFDFILDAVGKSSFKQCKPLLTQNGIYASTELGKNSANVWLALLTAYSKGKKVIFPIPTTTKADIEFLKDLVDNQKFRPVIDRSFPLEEIVQAYQYVETGQKTGNVILEINKMLDKPI